MSESNEVVLKNNKRKSVLLVGPTVTVAYPSTVLFTGQDLMCLFVCFLFYFKIRP